jgi:hypothetical protein
MTQQAREQRVIVKGLLVVVSVVFVGLQFFGPARTNPPVDAAQTLHAKSPIPQDVKAVLDRSCWNCHSNQTHWPWYSYVAPMSWMVIGHVEDGRSVLNFTEWSYSPEEGADLMDSVCAQVKRGRMPLREYTWMHWRAAVTEEEIKRICEWSGETADLLMASH